MPLRSGVPGCPAASLQLAGPSLFIESLLDPLSLILCLDYFLCILIFCLQKASSWSRASDPQHHLSWEGLESASASSPSQLCPQPSFFPFNRPHHFPDTILAARNREADVENGPETQSRRGRAGAGLRARH